MKKLITSILTLIILAFKIYAQPGSIDSTFNIGDLGFGYGDGANNEIWTHSIQNDGKIIIGGNFTSYDGTNRNSIARLNTDGTIDSTFNPGIGANSYVMTTSIQSDGKIIIAGIFDSFDGFSINRIARLNIDGSLDNSFDPGLGANEEVSTSAIQSDGKIIIGGEFTSYNGIPTNRIARLNTDGSLDISFNTGQGANASVNSISIQSNNKIIISGNLYTYNGIPIKRIVRLNTDGLIDNTFNTTVGVNLTIEHTSIQSDGKIIIGGIFTFFNGISVNRIARLNQDGTLDISFNPGLGANDIIFSTSVQNDGRIIIGGYLTDFNNVPRNKIARLNSDGTLDTSFDSGQGTVGPINTISILSNGKIIASGFFSAYNGSTLNRIVRLHANGILDTAFHFGTGANAVILTTAIQANGRILVGGKLTRFNNIINKYIVRLNTNGSIDTSFNQGTGANNYVNSISIQTDGKIIIGGNFNSFNGVVTNRIARLNTNGTIDNTFNIGTGANGGFNGIYSTLIQSDGKIIIGGDFTSYNGNPINCIARLNTDGTLDPSFNPGTGTNNKVRTITIQSDGKIIIGGDFTSYNGTGRNYIARLNIDGSLDVSFNPGMGANSYVFASSIQNDGKIIIGGDFTSYNVTSRNYIARLNSDGTLDVSFNPGTGANNPVWTTSIQSDGKILIGGDFTSYNGTGRNNIALLNIDGSLDSVFNQGIGASNSVYSISIQSDGNIIIGGNFTSYNSTGRNRVARIIGGTPTKITFNSNLPRNFVYPNPFSQQTTLKAFNLLKSASLTICNSQGQLVKEINNITGQTITIMRDNLPSGLYFVKLTEDNKVIIAERLVICE